MEAETIRQIYIFTIFIINGAIVGLFFDIFRILRKSFKTSDFITMIEDILFWMITGIFLIYSIFVFNNGEIRVYVLLGLAIGVILYMLLLSKYIIKVSVYIIDIFKKIFSFLFRVIIYPIKQVFSFIYHLFKKPFTFVFINIRKISSRIGNSIINIFKKSKKTEKNLDNKEGI